MEEQPSRCSPFVLESRYEQSKNFAHRLRGSGRDLPAGKRLQTSPGGATSGSGTRSRAARCSLSVRTVVSGSRQYCGSGQGTPQSAGITQKSRGQPGGKDRFLSAGVESSGEQIKNHFTNRCGARVAPESYARPFFAATAAALPATSQGRFGRSTGALSRFSMRSYW